MPYITIPIIREGAVVEIQLGVSMPRANAMKAAGQTPVPPIQIRALIDTGASATCIDPACVQQLGIPPTGQTFIRTPSTGNTPQRCNLYDVSLFLLAPNMKFRFRTLPVIEASLLVQGIHALLGRDALSQCQLVYDGKNNRCTLAF